MTMPAGKTSDGTWICLTTGERDAIGSDEKLQAGERAYVIGSGMYRCVSVDGADASTWIDLYDNDARFLGNLDLNSASPILTAGDGTGASVIRVNGANGSTPYFGLMAAGNLRWGFVKGATSDDLAIARYTGASVFQESPITISNSTGWVSLFQHTVLYNRTDANRGAAGTAGRIIFNTDDGKINIDTGANWTLADGTVT